MYHIFSLHSSVDGYLGCFHVLAIANSAAMNIGVHVPSWVMVFSGSVPRNRISESYDSFIISFLRNLHTVLHSVCIHLKDTTNSQNNKHTRCFSKQGVAKIKGRISTKISMTEEFSRALTLNCSFWVQTFRLMVFEKGNLRKIFWYISHFPKPENLQRFL